MLQRAEVWGEAVRAAERHTTSDEALHSARAFPCSACATALTRRTADRVHARRAQVCNCLLSGVPRLTLTFTSPHMCAPPRSTTFSRLPSPALTFRYLLSPASIEHAALHPCISRERWERERVMSFVPPDGKFELFSCAATRRAAHTQRAHRIPVGVALRARGAPPTEIALATVHHHHVSDRRCTVRARQVPRLAHQPAAALRQLRHLLLRPARRQSVRAGRAAAPAGVRRR